MTTKHIQTDTHSRSPRHDMARGALAILPATVAAMPFGLLLGADAVAKGLTPAEVLVMGMTVFAGSAQFLAVDLWGHPADWLALGLAALLINLRHVVMGASLAGKLGRFGRAGRWLAVFFMADEIWAVAEREALRGPLTPAFYAGAAATLYVNWQIATTAGALLGGLLAEPAAWGFDFAFTAIFIGLVAGFWRGRTTLAVAAASALAAIVAARLLEGAWFVLIGAGAGVAVAALAHRPERRP